MTKQTRYQQGRQELFGLLRQEHNVTCMDSDLDDIERCVLSYAVSSAGRDVLNERHRQITVEGWTPEHDDQHPTGALVVAAASYATYATLELNGDDLSDVEVPGLWPLSPEWWKPSTPRRDMIKAAALIIAEIERLDRQEARND